MSEVCFTVGQQFLQDGPPCECCGCITRVASGMIRLHGEPRAIYRVHWTPDKVQKDGARFYLVIGPIGEGVSPAERHGVALEYIPSKGGFTVLDADRKFPATDSLVGRLLARKEVVGTPLAEEVFALVDTIWLQDENIAEIVRTAPEAG